MKVIIEHISPDENSSFKVFHIKDIPISELNWNYHYHPEIEIVCVLKGKGTRHVGYHKSHFEDGALVMIGSNIPHSGLGLNATDPHEEIVILFKGEIDAWVCFAIEEKIERSQDVGLPAVISTYKYGKLRHVSVDRLN